MVITSYESVTFELAEIKRTFRAHAYTRLVSWLYTSFRDCILWIYTSTLVKLILFSISNNRRNSLSPQKSIRAFTVEKTFGIHPWELYPEFQGRYIDMLALQWLPRNHLSVSCSCSFVPSHLTTFSRLNVDHQINFLLLASNGQFKTLTSISTYINPPDNLHLPPLPS